MGVDRLNDTGGPATRATGFRRSGAAEITFTKILSRASPPFCLSTIAFHTFSAASLLAGEASRWARMNGVATTTDVRPKTISTIDVNAGPHAAAAIVWNRMIPRSAHLMRTPESNADTGVGAWLWASGSQRCIGARPAFVP